MNIACTLCYCRYTSRCLLIEFTPPQLDSSVSQFRKLKEVMEKSSSALGFIICRGKKFVEKGHRDIDEKISPKIKEVLGANILSRVRCCYSILMWFVLEVHNYMHNQQSYLLDICFTMYVAIRMYN